MINYIDYKKKEVHISENTSLNVIAVFLDSYYSLSHDFKIMIDGGTDENPDIDERITVPP